MKIMIPSSYFLPVDELCIPVDDLGPPGHDLRVTENARLLNCRKSRFDLD